MKKTLRDKIKKETLLLDGAFGTYIQTFGLKQEDFKGRPGCLEHLNFTRPDLIEKLHSDYLDAGSDAVETNTFGANALKLSEYGLSDKVYEVNKEAARIARSACDKFSSSSHPRHVIGTMGPTGKLPSSTDPELGNVTYKELKRIFYEQALGIIDGGADALLVETGQDLLEMKAAVNGAKEALGENRKDLVLMAQCTLANNGRMLLGTEISAVSAALSYLDVDVIGLNCSTGPLEMEPAIKYLSSNCPKYISCVPNAGLPIEKDGKTFYPLAPDEMAEIISRFASEYKIDVVGGCCGTDPGYIRKIREKLKTSKKRKISRSGFYASFYKGYNLEEQDKPVKVGERINAQGSKKMKDLLLEKDYDSIVELGKDQQNKGASLLDVCAVLSERSTEKEDAVILVRRLSESVQVPLMIDSTDIEVIEAALSNYSGTAFINSVNLEDGGDRARRVFELAKEHGSFVINLMIDEKGMAKTSRHKLDIAKRLYNLATKEYGIEAHRLIYDMLTFALGTGEKEYANAALETCNAIKDFKKHHPEALTALGVSNVSFGLSKPARKVLNAAFLYHAVRSGLDLAIVDPSSDLNFENFPSEEKKLAEELVLNKRSDALERFIEYFAKKTPEKEERTEKAAELSIEESIKRCVIERNKAGILPLVDEALKKYKPERIINEILMDVMREVGDKLDTGEMVLPYVLQSAEVMRKAIEHLEKFLPKDREHKKGKVLLATVFGDVHDIGKNLVKMILKNNGFSVIDLGKQVPIEKIVKEAKKQKVDAVGLSALLVSTARHMKTCVQSMHDAGLHYPILIGGAPINERFAKEISALEDNTIYKGGVFYARDAFTGLKIMQALMDTDEKQKVQEEYYRQFKDKEKIIAPEEKRKVVKEDYTKKGTREVPTPPFYGIRSLTNIPADEVFGYLDERLLFEVGWKAKLKDPEEKERITREELQPLLKGLKEECLHKAWLDLKAAYGYFKCRIDGNDMEILDKKSKRIEVFHFERVKDAPGGCLVDYFLPREKGEDIAVFQAVTVGSRINDAIEKLSGDKQETKAFFLHGLSVYLAEALAAYIHDRIRKELNLSKNQGKRYSPGYPLWKDLRDQSKIFKLLEIESRLKVTLTQEHQMVPEQSTTAMIVYDKAASY